MPTIQELGIAWRLLYSRDTCHRNDTRHLFDLMILHLDEATGIVSLARNDFARIMKKDPGHIGLCLRELEKRGIISRTRVPVGKTHFKRDQFHITPASQWGPPKESGE